MNNTGIPDNLTKLFSAYRNDAGMIHWYLLANGAHYLYRSRKLNLGEVTAVFQKLTRSSTGDECSDGMIPNKAAGPIQ